MWHFNLKTREWKEVKSIHTPEARRSHSMVLSTGLFWMFGGIQDVTKEKNDIYIFDPKTSEWTKILNSSNLVYECSPTMKMQKNPLKRVMLRLFRKSHQKKIQSFLWAYPRRSLKNRKEME
jgi:N-acetylneuraminic acid mutarotase